MILMVLMINMVVLIVSNYGVDYDDYNGDVEVMIKILVIMIMISSVVMMMMIVSYYKNRQRII